MRDRIALISPAFPKDVKDPQVVRVENENSEPRSRSRSCRRRRPARADLAHRPDDRQGAGEPAGRGADRRERTGARQILVQIKPNALTALGISVDQVISAIRDANQDVPAGRITRGSTDAVVRVEGKIKDPAEFGRIVVAEQGGGPVYLAQVAEVIDGEKDQDSISRVNGRPAITLDVQKAQDANIVDTGRAIRTAVEELRKRPAAGRRPAGRVFARRPGRACVNRVKSTIAEGAALTVLIVFLFLASWRSTIITGLTLPIAVVATFIALRAFGFTLNFLTLMALSLTIGLLIDDAIVVRENIVRHLGMGKDHAAAAREGTEEIGLAVMATTFAIVAVFVPIAFMDGIVGRFFFQFGVSVAVAVLVSLFVSFTLDPMLSSVWADPPGPRFARAGWLGRRMDHVARGIDALHRVYAVVLGWALSHRKSVLAIAPCHVRRELLRRAAGRHGIHAGGRPGFISLRLNTPVGSSLEYSNAQGTGGGECSVALSRDRADDDDRRHRRWPQLRAHQPEARRCRRSVSARRRTWSVRSAPR